MIAGAGGKENFLGKKSKKKKVGKKKGGASFSPTTRGKAISAAIRA